MYIVFSSLSVALCVLLQIGFGYHKYFIRDINYTVRGIITDSRITLKRPLIGDRYNSNYNVQLCLPRSNPERKLRHFQQRSQ